MEAGEGQQTDVGTLTTDMSKALNSMHPALFLSKLRVYGFQESLIRLLRSYLYDRYNRVKLASQKSSWRRVNSTIAVPKVQRWGCYCGTLIFPK